MSKPEIRATLADVRKLRSERIRRRRQLRSELADIEAVLRLDDLSISRLKRSLYKKPTTYENITNE